MAFEEARRFLAHVVPWPLQGEFYVNIVTARRRDQTKGFEPENLMWGGRACTTLAQAIGYIDYWVRTEPLHLYVCMSGQRRAKQVVDTKTGRTRMKAARHATDAVLLKGIWLDIDFKNYPSPQAMLQALAAFIHAVDLP